MKINKKQQQEIKKLLLPIFRPVISANKAFSEYSCGVTSGRFREGAWGDII